MHKGTFAPKDCNACHTESGFGKAPFDHATTAFALTGAHATARCEACHTRAKRRDPASRPAARTVEFRGAEGRLPLVPRRSARGRARRRLRALPPDDDLQADRLQPPPAGGVLRRLACDGGLRAVSQAGGRARAAAGAARRAASDGRPAAATAAPACTHAEAAPLRRGGERPATMAVHPVRFTAATTTCVSCHADVHLGPGVDDLRDLSRRDAREVPARARLLACEDAVPADREARDGRLWALPQAGGRHVPAGAGHRRAPHRASRRPARAVTPTCTSARSGPRARPATRRAAFAVTTYTHRDRSHRAFFSGRHATATCVVLPPVGDRPLPGRRRARRSTSR